MNSGASFCSRVTASPMTARRLPRRQAVHVGRPLRELHRRHDQPVAAHRLLRLVGQVPLMRDRVEHDNGVFLSQSHEIR